jgi:hypothetical protein
MELDAAILGSKVIQLGFAGLSIILLSIIVWLIKRLLDVLDKNTCAFCANTEAINNNTKMITEQKEISIEMKDLLLSKPCISERR